jgi:hypothetical protein
VLSVVKCERKSDVKRTGGVQYIVLLMFGVEQKYRNNVYCELDVRLYIHPDIGTGFSDVLFVIIYIF